MKKGYNYIGKIINTSLIFLIILITLSINSVANADNINVTNESKPANIEAIKNLKSEDLKWIIDTYSNIDSSKNKSNNKISIIRKSIKNSQNEFKKDVDRIFNNLNNSGNNNKIIHYSNQYYNRVDRYDRYLTTMTNMIYQDTLLSEEESCEVLNIIEESKEIIVEKNEEFDKIGNKKIKIINMAVSICLIIVIVLLIIYVLI